MRTTLHITVLLAIVMPALLLSQDNTTVSDNKATLQAKLSGTDIAAKLEALSEVEQHLLSLPALDKVQQDTWLPLLIGLLQDQDATASSQATELLKKLGKKFGVPVVDALLVALQSPHAMTRYLAAEALGEIGDKRAIAPLLKLMQEDKDVYARGSAASALGNLRATEVIEPLITLLQNQSIYRFARICAAEALGKLGDKRAMPSLIKALQDKEDYVRYAAAHALGEFPEQIIAEHLLTCVANDSCGYVRSMAVRSLVRMGERNPKLTLQRDLLARNSNAKGWRTLNDELEERKPLDKPPIPHLLVTVDGPRLLYYLKPIEYRITVVNQGETELVGCELSNLLPVHLEYMNASLPGKWNPVTRIVKWQLPPLQPTKSLEIAVTARSCNGGRCRTFARVQTNNQSTEAYLEMEIICSLIPLYILSYDTEDPVELGHQTTYVVEMRNEGTSNCTMIQMVSRIPEEMRFVKAEGPGVSCKYDNGIVVFDVVPMLPPGEKLIYKVTCLAIKPGSAKHTAILRYEEFFRNITDEEGTTVYK